MKEWTLARRLVAGFALSGLTLLVVAVVAYRSTTNLLENDDLVDHTYLVRTELANLSSQLKDAETGQRGYLLDGSDSYLTPYRTARSDIKTTLERLLQLTASNPSQQKKLATISSRIDAKFAELEQTIELRRSQGLDAALKMVATDQGKIIMDQLRELISAADREEAGLQSRRTEVANASAQWTVAVILWGSIIGVVAMSLVAWFIISAVSRQIGTAVGQVQSSSAELQSAASQQATSAKEQATAMNEITTTINELLATSRQIAESAQRVSHIANQTAAAAKGGNGTVDAASETISAIRRQVDQIVDHMLDLGRKSQEIGSVLDIVSELAEQTNILSINATIEAAGAGEAGKRFAVVAEEIRKLADRVGGSTKEIRTLIEDVRSAVNRTVMATETGSKSVDAGARQFGEVATAFGQISDQVGTTTDAAREIELSTKQQATAVEQVNLAISNVAQASKETEVSSGQTLQTATQLTGLSKDLLRIIRRQTVAA
jgi:methyl-accepting chemotaxis protein